MSIYIDMTEFLTSLRKTGIERIGGELCKYLPPDTAIPVRLESDRYLALPPALIGAIGGYFRNATEPGVAEIRRLSDPEHGLPITVSQADTLIVPELFAEDRATFFRELPQEQLQRCCFIVYDLLPVTHPEYFPPDMPLTTFGYFQTIRRADRCGFISEDTRDAYYARLRRTRARAATVLPLGSDSLGPRADGPTLNRGLIFSVLGTIEPRKNHELILDAFEPLLGQIEGLSLSFLGKMGWIEPKFAGRVQRLASDRNSGFQFHPTPSDGEIRSCIEQSRATIYVSAAEGYGLPPVESLWLGTPVIASTTIPSLKTLGSMGIEYVEPLNAVELRRAVLSFVDDDFANRKIEETAHLNLPTWQSFAQEVLRWCTA